MAASQKRSRKTKLVPRECTDFAVDKYLLLQEHIQPLLRQIPERGLSQTQSNVDIQPLLRQTIPGHREDPESFLKFNVQVEVEEYNEENKVEIVNDSERTRPARTTILCGKDTKISNESRKEIAPNSKRATDLNQTLLCAEREIDELQIDIVNDSLEDPIGEKSTPLSCESNKANKVKMVTNEGNKQTRTILYNKDRKTSIELEKVISTDSDLTSVPKLTSLLCVEKKSDELAMEIANNSLEDTIGKQSTTIPCEIEIVTEIVKDHESSTEETEIGNDPESSTEETEMGNDPESRTEETEISNDPESSIKETEIGNDPESSTKVTETVNNPESRTEETEIGNDPKSSTEATEIGNDPERSTEVMEIIDDSDSCTDPTETVHDPEWSTEETEIVNDPENSTEPTETVNDPEWSTEETEIGNDPESSTEVVEIVDDPDSCTEVTETVNDPEISTKPTATLLSVKDRKARSILRKEATNDLGNAIRKHANNYLKKEPITLSFNELEKKNANEKKKHSTFAYSVDRETLKELVNEISKKTTNIADKVIEIELKNVLGKKLDVVQLGYHDNLIQKALQDWRAWYHQSKLRECIVSYKCYICDLAWWHLTPFRYHIRIHKEPKIGLETILRECYLICYSKDAKRKDVEIDGNCWRCQKSSKKHMFKYRKDDLTFQCEGCSNSFFPCTNLLKHEAICQRYHKIIFKDTVRHESDWKCNICGLNLLTKERFELHLSGYHSVRSDVPLPTPLQKTCYTCDQEYHLFSSHTCLKKNCNFQCTNCFRRFQTNWFVEFHLKMTKRNIDCRICHKCLKTQCMEMEHMVRHSDNYVQAYRCLFCEDYVLFSNLDAFRLHAEIATGHIKKSGTRLVRNYCEIMIVPKSCLTKQSPKIVSLEQSKYDSKQKIGEKRKMLQSETSGKRKKPNSYSLLKKPVLTKDKVQKDQTQQDKINLGSEIIMKIEHSDCDSDVEIVNTDDDDIQVITDDDDHVQLGTDDKNHDETVKVEKENSVVESEDVSLSNVFQPSKSLLNRGNDNRAVKLKAYEPDDKFTYEKMLAKVLQSSGNIPETFTFSTEMSDDEFEDDIIVLNTNLIKDSNLSDIDIVNPIEASNLVPGDMVSSNLVPDEIVASNLVPDDMISSNLELNYTVTTNSSTDKSNKKREPVKNNPKTNVSNSDLNKATSNTEPNETTTSNSVPNEIDKTNLGPNINQIRIKQEPIEDSEHNTQQERELNINIIKTETIEDINDTNVEEASQTQDDNTNVEETPSREELETLLDIKSEENSDYSHDSLEIDEEELKFRETCFMRKIVGDRGGKNTDGNLYVEGVTRRRKYRCTRCGFQGSDSIYITTCGRGRSRRVQKLIELTDVTPIRDPRRTEPHRAFSVNSIGIEIAHHAQYKRHIDSCCPRQKQKSAYTDKSIWNKIKCSKCNETFAKIQNYILHFSRHNIPHSSCPQCLYKANIPSAVGPHLLKHVKTSFVRANYINKESISRNVYRCTVCKQKGILFRDLMQHWESHLVIKTTVEVVEPKLEQSDDDDDSAVTTALPSDLLKKLTDLLQLPTASYNSGKRTIANDVRVCSLCDKTFARRTDCKRHIIEHLRIDALANRPKYSALRCQICHYLCARSDTYRQHMRDHGFLPIYKCELCNKSFSDSSNFAKHKKVHNLMVLICDICLKKFHSKKQLIKHIEYHKTTEPFQCVECDRTSFSLSAHKKHMKIHTGVHTFSCPICKYRAVSLRQKWDHMWYRHGERNVKADCPLCKMRFRTLQKLKAHMRDEHDLSTTFPDIIDGIRSKTRTIKTTPGTSGFQLRNPIMFDRS